MATKNNPGKYDCYQNAEPDEPMFVLLARDKHAPALIWLWRVLRELDGEEPEKLKEAGTCAVEMMLWQKDHGRKAVGVTQAVLAGILEMTRVINNTKEEFHNDKTDEDVFRRYLCFAQMQDSTEAEKPTGEFKYGNAAGLEARLLPGEPWFALRARDVYSVKGVEAYAKLCEEMGLVDHAAGVRQAIKQMFEWQCANPDKVKIPD